jgi:hypothetical protein
MHKFSTRNMLIFVIGLVLAVVLIGLGTAYVVQFKHRVLSGVPNSALTGRAERVAARWRGQSVDFAYVRV